MSLSRIAQFVIGLILAIFGLFLVINTAAGLPATWIQTVIGLGSLALGVYIMMIAGR